MNDVGPRELDKPLDSFEIEFDLYLDALFAIDRGLSPNLLSDLLVVWHGRMMC